MCLAQVVQSCARGNQVGVAQARQLRARLAPRRCADVSGEPLASWGAPLVASLPPMHYIGMHMDAGQQRRGSGGYWEAGSAL